ncbi:MAG TPA: hypothetical protein VGG63_08265 [Steroidobacteraceae bacterium]
MSGKQKVWAKCVVIAAAWPLLSSCSSNIHLSFLDPQGPVADMQRLHFLEVLALLAIFVALPVFLVTPWFAWRYRYGASPRHTPKWNFYGPLDIACWAGAMVIVGLLGALLWGSTHALDPYKPLASDQPALRVQVIGYDWKWLFIYPDQGVASIGELAFPAGRPLAMQLTSATVMQSLLTRRSAARFTPWAAWSPNCISRRPSPVDSWVRTRCTTAVAFPRRSSPRSR